MDGSSRAQPQMALRSLQYNSPGPSRENLADHVASLPREPLVQSVVKVGKLSVIEPHQVQDGRVQIGYMHRLLHRFESKFVRGTDRLSAFHTGTGQPHGEAVP